MHESINNKSSTYNRPALSEVWIDLTETIKDLPSTPILQITKNNIQILQKTTTDRVQDLIKTDP